MSDSGCVLCTENLHKNFQAGEVTVRALRGISLEVKRGEFLGIVGPSGSGKSTLLGLIGGLDTPSQGRVILDGVDITNLSERALTRIRNEKIGFVFQSFNLIPTLTALENVALPIQFSRQRKRDARKRAAEVLEMLGLADRLHHRPSQLSGGEQQRVAIARALANEPPLLLADEPTGNLDTVSSQVVLEALRNVQTATQTTLVVVTHDMDVASQADRLVFLVDGRIAEDIDTRGMGQQAVLQLLKGKQTGSKAPALALEDIAAPAGDLADERLVAARELLLSRRYSEARKLLAAMPHSEIAARWLAQLDEITPQR